MNKEFKKLSQGDVTRYVLENASSGGTSSGSVASVSMPVGGTRKRGDNLITQEADKKTEPPKTRNPVAKNASAAIGGGAAGAHKDKSKTIPRKEKHKKPYMETLQARLDQLKSKVAEGNEWQGNRGNSQAGMTDHTFDEAKQYIKGNYPFHKTYNVSRVEPGMRYHANPEKVANKTQSLVTGIDSALDYLQVKQNPMMSGSTQVTPSIGYSWHTHENPANGIAVLYYEDRGMGNDTITIAAKDRNNLKGAVQVCRDAGVIPIPPPKVKEQGVAEGFNGEYDDEAGMAQSNLLTTARAVMGLLKTIKDRDNLPEWGQEKIAKAEMMLVSVWDYLQSQKAMGNDPQQGVEEGWDDIKKFGKKAAVAGAIGLGIGAANAGGWSPSDVPAGGHNQLPDIVANVKFKVGDKEVSKEINLGSHYRSPGEAGEELKNFLNSKGIKFYQYSLERVKPKANDKIDNSPATSDMKGSIDTSEPGATGPSTDNYMAKDNDPERGPSTGGKFVKEDPYLESLQSMMERQLEPNMDLDTWVDNFQNADPNKYHQFKNKTPEKKK